jgi:acyl carrier protein
VGSKDEILENINKIMSNTFDLDDLKVTRETTVGDIGEWDSLSHVRLPHSNILIR